MALHAKHRRSGVRGAIGRAGQGAASYAGADYSSDPILQQIRALAIRNDATAESQAADARRQELLNYGYVPGLDYGDQATATAAQQSPFSVLAQLQRSHDQRTRSIDENTNRANLYYSSYRGQQLGNEGTNYLGDQANASQHLQGVLAQIAGNLASAKQTSQERIMQAEQDAYQRALSNALKYGYGTPTRARPKHRGKR